MLKRTLLALLCSPIALMAQQMEEEMPPRDSGISQMLVMVAMIMVFFYFIMWRPDQKRRQELANKLANLKKGDQVVANQIIGSFVEMDDQTVTLSMVDGAKVKFLRGAVTDFIPQKEEKK